jgi:hypothetical protein
MFYIPAMTYAYSSNLGDTLVHAKRVIDYVRFTWPFFNRCAAILVLCVGYVSVARLLLLVLILLLNLVANNPHLAYSARSMRQPIAYL